MPFAPHSAIDRALVGADAPTSDSLPSMRRPLPPSGAPEVVAELRAARERLHEVVRLVPVGAWSTRPAPGRWTACEILEHLALTEWAVLECLREALAAPARAGARGIADDAEVLRAATDRGVRCESPERLLPVGRWLRPAALCASVDAARDAALALAEGQGAALRGCAIPHPYLGLLDGVQWLLFLAGHTRRHAAQLEELVAARRRTSAA